METAEQPKAWKAVAGFVVIAIFACGLIVMAGALGRVLWDLLKMGWSLGR